MESIRYSNLDTLDLTLRANKNFSPGSAFFSNTGTVTNALISNTTSGSITTTGCNSVNSTISSLIAEQVTMENCIMTHCTTGILGYTPPIGINATFGNTTVTQASSVNLLISGAATMGYVTSNLMFSGTVGSISSVPNSTISSVLVDNPTVTNIRVTACTTSSLAGRIRITYANEFAVSNDTGGNLTFSVSDSTFPLNIVASNRDIWVGTTNGNVRVGGVVQGGVGSRTSGSTLSVESSTGGSNALVQANGNVSVRSTIVSTTTSTGSIKCAGGVGIVKDLNVGGALSKGSGTFNIPHPNPLKTGYRLRHSFVESPTRGDNIYRYSVNIKDRQGIIDLPDYFEFLNENIQVFVRPIGNFSLGYGVYNKLQNTITINTNADGEYNVLIIGTRRDSAAVSGWDAKGVCYKGVGAF